MSWRAPSSQLPKQLLLYGAFLVLGACADLSGAGGDSQDGEIRRIEVIAGDDGSTVGVDVLITDEQGNTRVCGEGVLEVTIEVKNEQGQFQTLPVTDFDIQCKGAGGGQFALVMDNSWSSREFFEKIRGAAQASLDTILGRGGAASLVRIGTDATVLSEISEDRDTLQSAADAMWVDGYTALFDGIRVGNETLGRAAAAGGSPSDHTCLSRRKHGVVVFTDGLENNSDESQDYDKSIYLGDGLDTTAEDLRNLRVDGVATPIFSIGLGAGIDHDLLSELSAHNGGKHLPIADATEIADAFAEVIDDTVAEHSVCARMPTSLCGTVTLRVTTRWAPDEYRAVIVKRHTTTTNVDCDAGTPHAGRRAALLLTLSDGGIDQQSARTLAGDIVRQVTDSQRPQVLVVLDDNHHGESTADHDYVAQLLDEAGFDVGQLLEPVSGLQSDALAGYDVVWLSNPGYPSDDPVTLRTLAAFARNGGGIVLQGDDMSWTWGYESSLTPLTGLLYTDNGASTCGLRTNDNEGYRYQVTVDTDAAAQGLFAGVGPFFYGDDIDHTVAAGIGERVLAWAELAPDGRDVLAARGETCDLRIPVAVVLDD